MKFFSELTVKIKGTIVFLDIDGTLCGESGKHPDPAALKVLKRLNKTNEIYLCSNGKDLARNRGMAKLCGVDYLETHLRKPNPEILKLVSHKKGKPLLVIGNLNYTDGRFARNIGARFIKVRTVLGPSEGLLNRLLYWFDEHVIVHFL